MTMLPLTAQSWTPVPPLDLPLTFRHENGRFGSLRPKPLTTRLSCTTGQGLPAGDPHNPTPHDIHFINQIHEAVDLAATAGDCVFAAYSGRVAAVEIGGAGTHGAVTIDHHPTGRGFVTKYNHITDIAVSVGDPVQKGAPFAAVSAEPAEPHLHFELWAVVDPGNPAASNWPDDNDLLPVDPTRMLYSWEQQAALEESSAGPVRPVAVGLTSIHTVPFFTARFDTGVPAVVHVPLYPPTTAAEQLAVDVLRDSHRLGRDVTLHWRPSSFWGVDVVTQVELH
jgi:hypothetical protein